MDKVDKLHLLMETVYRPIVELARRHRLPVIDLPRFACRRAPPPPCLLRGASRGPSVRAWSRLEG
jgi:hypothetical protein